MPFIAKLSARIRKFSHSRRGNVAMIYGLAIVPLVLAAGAGIDFARAVLVRASLSEALDAAALAVGSSPGLTQAQQLTLAQQYFNANYQESADYGTPTAVAITPNGQSMVVATSDAMPTTMIRMVGINTMTVQASSTVVWGQLKVWVSLVLDNTGSMCQSDTNPNASSPCNPPASGTKIASLKTATQNLLTMLQNAASNPGDVKVAIIPFVKDVNIGTGNVSASWLDWTDWNANNGTCSGSGTNGTTQSVCTVAHCSKSQYTTKSTCQSHSGTWYNAGTWTASNHSNWAGCVEDRGNSSGPDTVNNYDTMNTAPGSSTASKFPTEQYSNCPQSLMGLSYDWTSLNNKVNAMVAGGSTNQTIGLVWGWHALTNANPLNSGALPAATKQYIIILSDGLNTQDRWYGDGSNQSTQVDDRMSAVCTNAKAAGVTIYAVFVDIGGTQGNSTVLQNCATDSSKYFDLTSASQINAAFNAIGQQITNLRLTH
ncbi:MAG TPA: TadE/TadG family type IV pilus assembly protein [Rhizomicrobium sp.]|nr:TadE/TadG family type IV pilus assembly protein [Rhizomicrobium sp.]